MVDQNRQTELPNRITIRITYGLGLLLSLIPLVVLGRSYSTNSRFQDGRLEKVWGQEGITPGSLYKPRAMAVDSHGDIYIVDKTARIQVFDSNGKYLRGWRTPAFANGKPTGLSFDRNGNLLVADTHYFRILFYSAGGKFLQDRTLGGQFGTEPGEFGLVTDVATDSKDCLYVSEYGEFDRIQKFAPDGTFMLQWGGHGSEPGRFKRPQSVAIDEQDRIWVADACNHRIQVFDASCDPVRCVQVWGTPGNGIGQLRYPYSVLLVDEYVYVCEFGNHRVQKFTRDGTSVGVWGTRGRKAGELFNPWAICLDRHGRIHVLDTYNHRVQRIRL
jgi:DNA-binding beta-propeller fold protein YncE